MENVLKIVRSIVPINSVQGYNVFRYLNALNKDNIQFYKLADNLKIIKTFTRIENVLNVLVHVERSLTRVGVIKYKLLLAYTKSVFKRVVIPCKPVDTKSGCMVFIQPVTGIYNDVKLCDTKLNDTRLNDTRLNDTRLNDTRLNDTRLNDTRLIDTRLNDTKLNDTRLNDTRLNDIPLSDTTLCSVDYNRCVVRSFNMIYVFWYIVIVLYTSALTDTHIIGQHSVGLNGYTSKLSRLWFIYRTRVYYDTTY